MDLEDFISNVQNLDAKDLIIEAAGKVTDDLADLNRQNLNEGKLASGDDTQEYASLPYANFKSSIGSISVPNMDFKVTGSLHDGIYFKTVGDEIEKGSTDSKAGFIQQNWGDDVFGVQEDQLIESVDTELPDIIDKKMMK